MASKLPYQYLGNSGLKVSCLCLGTMTFGEKPGGPVQTSDSDAFAMLDAFAARGGNFIDTADVYSQGKSEEIVGKWLKKQKREDFVIATKVRFPTSSSNPNACGLSRWNITHGLEQSLKRLHTTYIDLFQIHCSDPATPLEETLSTLHDLVRQGKVRYLGASNLTGWQLQKVVDLCKMNNWTPFITLQQQWSLLCRETEFELVDVCANEGIGLLPWSPLKGGWLTGKFEPDMTSLPTSRVAWVEEGEGRKNQSHPSYGQFADNEKVFNLLDTMKSIAHTHRKTVAQVALRWLLQQGVVPSVVMGARTLAQLEDNMGACGWSLSPSEMELLDSLTEPELPYPYEMVRRVGQSRQRSNFCK